MFDQHRDLLDVSYQALHSELRDGFLALPSSLVEGVQVERQEGLKASAHRNHLRVPRVDGRQRNSVQVAFQQPGRIDRHHGVWSISIEPRSE
jgi:hypothetical protein